MILPEVNFKTKQFILQSIEEVADTLAKKAVLKVNDVYYRVIDFEFYVYTESKEFQDLHTYKGKLQQQRNRLYLHYSGVDITIGDGVNYGGILLRSVVKLYKNKIDDSECIKEKIEGPQVVSMELFSNLQSLNSSEKNEIILVNAKGIIPDFDFPSPLKIIKTTRVGLSKSTDKSDFQDEPLRYIAVFSSKEKFNYKIKGIDGLLGAQYIAGNINRNEAEDILGYKKSFVQAKLLRPSILQKASSSKDEEV